MLAAMIKKQKIKQNKLSKCSTSNCLKINSLLTKHSVISDTLINISVESAYTASTSSENDLYCLNTEKHHKKHFITIILTSCQKNIRNVYSFMCMCRG